MIYRITCDYFIEADDRDYAEQICKEDMEFVEHHVSVSPASTDDLENIEMSRKLDPSDKWYVEVYNKSDRSCR